ncbi:hypothetical protein TanjilG_26923 [Lupinus angustifolius]|uniref:DUF3082 domain-containing protein n=1 Tax=Lupinus angustifolius TaxID=3871 RepID=A0A4P1RJJ5_LUPAN|nr:PREDICTED: uncharacterized protein LOC109348128 [Lupinus angustifolius]OIW11557.1 hypothetical protein TanjilG_26923 [Lupinus angustifolius]
MLHSHTHCFHHHHHFLFTNPIFTNHKSSLTFLHKPNNTLHSLSLSAIPPLISSSFLADLTTAVVEDGPIELPFSSTPSIFATTDDPSPIQLASSILLTGAISVFLFRSLRRRANRSKELQYRSTGTKKSIKEEALDSLKALGSSSIDAKGPPSPVQALFGGISAGIIALILYKFATTIEASLNRQTISDNFSVRQITITIRTVINGLTYLATFVFGLNSLGLFLYSGQLAINSFMEGSTENESESKFTDQSNVSNSSVESPTSNTESSSGKEEQSSKDAQ